MVGEVKPRPPQNTETMKREVKKAVSRIRRAQDAVLNNKVSGCHCMSIDCSIIDRESEQVRAWWTIFCHRDDDPEKCRSWRLADDDLESIDKTLQEVGEYLNYQV